MRSEMEEDALSYYVGSEWIAARRWMPEGDTKVADRVVFCGVTPGGRNIDAEFVWRNLQSYASPVPWLKVSSDGWAAIADLGSNFITGLGAIGSDELGREPTVDDVCSLLERSGFARSIPRPRADAVLTCHACKRTI